MSHVADKGNMRIILPDTQYGIAEQVEKWIKQERDSKLANRLNAIRLLMLGYEQQEVARIGGVTRRCVLRWVTKWNQGGKEELTSKSGGFHSKITPEIKMDVSKIIDVEKSINGRVITGKLICGYLKKSTR